MKPVFQTKKGIGGNCLAACLASLFEIELDSIPDLAPPGCVDDFSMQPRLRKEWLASIGYEYLEIDLRREFAFTEGAIPEGPCLLAVQSRSIGIQELGCAHFVVGELQPREDKVFFQVLHDPLGDILRSYEVLAVGFLIPKSVSLRFM